MASLGSYKNFLYKAYGNQGATILIPLEFQNRIKRVVYRTPQGDIPTSYLQGNSAETGALKFNLNRPPEQVPGGTVVLELDDGTVLEQPIENPLMDFRQGQATSPQNMNSGPGGGGGGSGPFGPNQVGQYGFAPAYMGAGFPSPVFTNFQSIKAAPYRFTDPFEFAQKYGDFARGELAKDYGFSKELAMDTLSTELSALEGYAPAAGALKRRETALDNIFNQLQRTQQLEAVMPEAFGQLTEQGQRAETLARGRLPSDIEDRALELGVRSGAADIASAGGFGARSSVARKTSDLLSAQQRLEVSKYGDQLLGANIGAKANLLLAPTSYSDAGQQIRVMPSVSPSELISSTMARVTGATGLPTTQAFTSEIQQQQFRTNQIQGTRQFNAEGQFQESQLNAQIANNFGLTKWQYDVGYAAAQAGAAQENLNTEQRIQQQAEQRKIFEDAIKDAKRANEINAGSAIVTGILNNWDKVTELFDDVGTWLGYGSDAATSTVTTGTPSLDAEAQDFLDFLDDYNAQEFNLDPNDTDTSVTATQAARFSSFSEDLGFNLKGLDRRKAGALDLAARATMGGAGISRLPRPGTVSIGYGTDGKPLYADAKLLRSTSLEEGSRFLDSMRDALAPFSLFNAEDDDKFSKLISLTRNGNFMRGLDSYYINGDFDSFVKELRPLATRKPSARRKRAARRRGDRQ